jgi:hypothetical protein
MSFRELMGIPIKTFWLLSENIERISAQKDIRSLSVAAYSQSGEGASEHREQLVLQVGTTVKLDSEDVSVRDEEGFEDLRNMATQ